MGIFVMLTVEVGKLHVVQYSLQEGTVSHPPSLDPLRISCVGSCPTVDAVTFSVKLVERRIVQYPPNRVPYINHMKKNFITHTVDDTSNKERIDFFPMYWGLSIYCQPRHLPHL